MTEEPDPAVATRAARVARINAIADVRIRRRAAAELLREDVELRWPGMRLPADASLLGDLRP